jgi:hypothetical protein
MCGILIAMGWFAIGWIARGHENHKYAHSRLRALADQAVENRREYAEPPPRYVAERVEQPQVHNHFHLSPSAQHPWAPIPQPPVVDPFPREIA